ncbi:DUF3606 domain-containing protein [Chitinophagaceae bacterium MMS25-I14]
MIQIEEQPPVNQDRITVENPADLKYWCNRFRLSEEELKEIIYDLGRSPLAMETYLHITRKTAVTAERKTGT